MTMEGWPMKAALLLRWLERQGARQGGAGDIAREVGLTPREVGQVLARLERVRVERAPRNGHGNASATWDLEMRPPKSTNRTRDKGDTGHG